MSMAEALAKYFRVETNSTILPYIVRDHAWNMDHHDMSGSFFRYRDDAPDGYKEFMDFECPHQTNYPIGNIECGSEHADDDDVDDDDEVCAEGDDECEAEAAEEEDEDDADEDGDDEEDDDEPGFEDDGEEDEEDEADEGDDDAAEDDGTTTIGNVTIPSEFHQKNKPSLAKSKDPQPIGKLLKTKKNMDVGGSRIGNEHKKPVMKKPVDNLVTHKKKIHHPKNKYFDELRTKNLVKDKTAAPAAAAVKAPTPQPIMKALEDMNRRMGVKTPVVQKKAEVQAPKKVEVPAPKPVEQPAQAKTEVKKPVETQAPAPKPVAQPIPAKTAAPSLAKPAEVAKPAPAKAEVVVPAKAAPLPAGVEIVNPKPAAPAA